MTLITFMDRTNISVAAPAIAKEFQFTKTEMGLIFGAFGFAYALGQVPGGWLGDRYGARIMLTIVVLFWSVMTMGTALATGFTSMLAIRFLFGLGEAGALPATTTAVQNWYPKSERGSVNGVVHSCGQFAYTLVPLLAVTILMDWGWRAVFYSFGAAGAVWSIAWYLMYSDQPADHPRVNATELARIQDGASDRKAISAVPWRKILKSRDVWFVALAYCGHTYAAFFFWYWMPDYLMEFHHIPLATMRLLNPIPLFAGAVGLLLGGIAIDVLYKWTKTLKWSRRWVCIASMVGGAIMMFPSALLQDTVSTIIALAICNFFVSMSVAPSWAVTMDIGGEFSGSVSSVMNMVGQIAGSCSAILFGALVQHISWTAPFYVITAVMIGSAILWLFIDAERSIARNA